MGHVQDPPVSTNMNSIVCMIYHMKLHMFGYNLGQKFFQNPTYFDHFLTKFNETSYSDFTNFLRSGCNHLTTLYFSGE